jgi:hypothetical protein
MLFSLANSWWSEHGDAAGSTAVAAAIAFIGIGVTVWIARKPKTIDGTPRGTVGIVTAEAASNVANGLSVRYNSFELASPRLVRFRIENSGRREVLAADFSEPMRLQFPTSVVFSDGWIVGESSPGIAPQLYRQRADTSDGEWFLSPSLLNVHEWFEAQFVVDGPAPAYPSFECRFAGQTRLPRPKRRGMAALSVAQVSAATASCVALLVLLLTDDEVADSWAIAGLVGASLASVAVVTAFFRFATLLGAREGVSEGFAGDDGV